MLFTCLMNKDNISMGCETRTRGSKVPLVISHHVIVFKNQVRVEQTLD